MLKMTVPVQLLLSVFAIKICIETSNLIYNIVFADIFLPFDYRIRAEITKQEIYFGTKSLGYV